jgi:hypothetical protein
MGGAGMADGVMQEDVSAAGLMEIVGKIWEGRGFF